ncbi:MAG: hypothetical protein U9Q15_04765 [Patescibacteria group bacterium]|nr:hypothetical protein [Patescibacteria group bacterium]
MNKILMMNNLLPMMVFEENTQKYFNAIRSAETGYKQKYYSFMLDQYKKTLEQVYYRKIK